MVIYIRFSVLISVKTGFLTFSRGFFTFIFGTSEHISLLVSFGAVSESFHLFSREANYHTFISLLYVVTLPLHHFIYQE